MVELQRFKEDRVIELYNRMWQVVSERTALSVDDARRRYEIRKLWSEDFDGHTESDYIYSWSVDGDQTTDGDTFHMQPITRFEVIGVYGWHNGNVGITVNFIKVFINNTKIREYFGRELASEINDVYVFDDPFYVTATQNFKMEPNTTGASATSRAFPLGWVIRAR